MSQATCTLDDVMASELDLGPRVLGRGLIVKPGQVVPEAFADVERVTIRPAL